jgi:hypothetical protein
VGTGVSATFVVGASSRPNDKVEGSASAVPSAAVTNASLKLVPNVELELIPLIALETLLGSAEAASTTMNSTATAGSWPSRRRRRRRRRRELWSSTDVIVTCESNTPVSEATALLKATEYAMCELNSSPEIPSMLYFALTTTLALVSSVGKVVG